LSFLDPDLPDVAGLIEEAQTRILENRDTPVHFTLEYFDADMVDAESPRQNKALAWLREKYRGDLIDLVVAVGAPPGAFEGLSRAKLFPRIPIVFFVVDPEGAVGKLKIPPGGAGVVQRLNYLSTLQSALRQNPGTRRVIVVSGSSGLEKRQVAAAREQFRQYESSVDFQYWTNLKFSELRTRLATAESDSVVLFLNFIKDASGEQFTPARVLRTIAGTSNRPFYGTYLSFVGNGVVGGHVADLHEVGRILGAEGARILNGEKPENIAIENGEFQRDVFDRRQLRRWRISEERLPEGSTLLFWEYSLWELYRSKILGLIALIGIETLLIVLLVRNRASRKSAEESLRQREAQLFEAQRLAELGSWQWNPRNDEIILSDNLCNVLGFPAKTAIRSFSQLADLFMPQSRALLTQRMEKALSTGESFLLELEGCRADSAQIWISARGEVVSSAAGEVTLLRGTMQDITSRKRAEEARLKHAVIVESSNDAIISKDPNGSIVSWNSAAERIFGYNETEVVGKPITLTIPPDLQSEEKTILKRADAGERIEHYETVRLTKDGKRVDVALTICPIKDATGAVVGSSEIACDITQRIQAEQQLKKSEEMFSKAFRHGPMALTLTSADTHQYIDVNETFERLTGYRRDELIGRSALSVGIWTNPEERAKFAKRLLAEGHFRDAEVQFRTKEDQVRIVQGSAELIEIGAQQWVLGAAIDITDRKQAEQAVLESEKRFRLMADSTPVLMWLSGPDKLCNDFNKEWLRFTGRTMQEELGEGWTQNVHPDDLRSYLQIYTQAFDARQKFSMEYRLRRHDGEYRWMLDRGVPRFLEDGGFAGYIGCCVDITDQKKAKAVLAELSGRLIQAQEEERARIARELHDDINQRLALLANGLQEAVMTRAPRKSQQVELRQLWQLTNDIATDIQHLSHRLHPSKLHYLGLPAAARELCLEFSRQQKIEVECIVRDVPTDLDDTVSLCLFRTIQEALRNIGKHSQAQHVKVEVIGESQLVRLRVADDGVGFNADEPTDARGIGLVSMRERLKSVGGDVSIWSRPSSGTVVEGTVPVIRTRAQSA